MSSSKWQFSEWGNTLDWLLNLGEAGGPEGGREHFVLVILSLRSTMIQQLFSYSSSYFGNADAKKSICDQNVKQKGPTLSCKGSVGKTWFYIILALDEMYSS